MRRSLFALALASVLVAFAPGGANAQPRTDVTIGLVLEPPVLDPTAEAAAAVDEVVYANVFEGLVRFAEDGAVVPALAHAWDVSEDGLAYTFHLNEGVRFHDGTPMTAEDVKFSLERINAEGSQNAQQQLYADITSVEVIDPVTARVNLSRPNGDFLYNLAWGDAVIVSPATAATNVTEPVGTGPFRFDSRIAGDRITLVRNPDYWGEPVALERATFRFIDDPSAAFGALMAGDVDAFPNFPARETVAQFEADPRFTVVVGNTQGETVLAMNNQRPPLDDVRVRAAIAHAIDRQAVIDGAEFGFGTPIGSFMPPFHPDYLDLTPQSAYDPDRSRELLAEAGWDAGTVLSLKLPPAPYARRAGEIIARQLAEVGIRTSVTNVLWPQWLAEAFNPAPCAAGDEAFDGSCEPVFDYDLSIVAHTEPNDIGVFGRDAYYFNYRSEAFREIMTELAVTADPARRSELLQAAQRQLADDYAAAFLFQLAKVGVQDARLNGLWENAPTQATDLTAVHWDE